MQERNFLQVTLTYPNSLCSQRRPCLQDNRYLDFPAQVCSHTSLNLVRFLGSRKGTFKDTIFFFAVHFSLVLIQKYTIANPHGTVQFDYVSHKRQRKQNRGKNPEDTHKKIAVKDLILIYY
ncbi:hypothetical protein H1C71_020653 [Ictidomys tridecemlineatus]|nr:hypothetical protein H1C71_020653 [Ictidomys tridecemlineatus]